MKRVGGCRTIAGCCNSGLRPVPSGGARAEAANGSLSSSRTSRKKKATMLVMARARAMKGD